MGGATSTVAIHSRIDSVLPHHTYELAETPEERTKLVSHVQAVFPGGSNDRGQFVHSCRILLSSNGKVALGDKRFRLVYSRAPEEFRAADDDDGDNAQVFVSIVAISSEGVLAAKIVSERAGRNKVEAFKMFRKTVEMRMHNMLDSVPGPADISGSSSAPMIDEQRNLSAVTIASTVLPDEPPSYQEASK